MKKRRLRLPLAVCSLGLLIPTLLYAQQQPVGVVTALQGKAQLTRAAQQADLRFKENVILQDVIDTREQSLARILFGGRSTVTVRELSRLEVREEILPNGARRDVHDLSSGAILVNVAKQLMRPGDEVQIRTPNAVAAVRGTTVFAGFNARLNQSFFAFLSGTGILTPQGLPSISLTANTSNNGANVTGSGPNINANVFNVPLAQALQILQESHVGKVVKEESNKNQVADAAVKEAATLANAVLEALGKGEKESTGEGKKDGSKGSTEKGDNQPPKDQDPGGQKSKTASETSGSGNNIVKNPGFETTGSIPDWDSSGAAAIITSMKDGSGNVVFSPTEKTHMAIIHTGTGASSSTTSILSQTNSTDIKTNKTYKITFDYLFMTNEFPHEATTFNDKFTATAKGLGPDGGNTEIITESRNSSTFKTDKGKLTSSGSNDSGFSNFELSSGNGYTDWKTASKTVQSENVTSGTLEFKIIDVGDTVVDSAVLIDNVVVKKDPPLY